MKAGIGLYVKNSAEAVELYKEAFGLELGYHVKNADGSYYHSELYRDGEEVLSVVESKDSDHFDNVVQVGIILDNEAEVRKAFGLLSDGGTVQMPVAELPWSPCAAVLRDRFGVWWYISVLQHRPDESFDPSEPADADASAT